MKNPLVTLLLSFWCFALVGLTVANSAHAEQIAGRDVIISDQRGSFAGPAPLIVALHPNGSSPRQFRKSSQLDRAARDIGAIVIYPPAPAGWQIGTNGDVAFLRAVITGLQRDPRIAAFPALILGHGQGGAMALHFACEAPDMVAGLGIVSTKLPRSFRCARGPARPAMFIHGTADPIQAHDGDTDHLSATQTVATWAKRNGCSDAVRIRKIDQNKRDKTSVVSRRYTACRAVLEHLQILGGGHGWPTGAARKSSSLGPQTGEIAASPALVTFLAPLVRR
ncbi:MAG: PHB depolymerase family esterase [Paracoccaceae bacterium]